MHTYYEAKDMLKRELDQIVKKGELSAGSLETIDKLLNSIKNACKIVMYEEYSEEGDYSSQGGSSYARGRGSNARRDSMGRYAREGGYSGENYSEARGGRGGGRSSRRGGYSSYADGNDEKIEMLREMMQESNSEEERRSLQKIIRRYEQE